MSVPSVSVPIHAPVSIHAAVLGTLLVDTFHQVPKLHRVDFFFTGDVEVGPFEHGVQREVGSEADMLAEGRNHFFHGSNQFVAVADVSASVVSTTQAIYQYRTNILSTLHPRNPIN